MSLFFSPLSPISTKPLSELPFFLNFYLLYFSNTIATITIFFFLFPLSYFSKTIARIIIFFLSSLFWQHLWCNNNLFFFFFSFLLFQQNHLELPFFFIFSYFGNTIVTITIFFSLLSPISANPLLSSPILVTPLPQLQFFFSSPVSYFGNTIVTFTFSLSSIFGQGQSISNHEEKNGRQSPPFLVTGSLFFGHRKGKNWVAIVALRMPNLFFSLLSPL